MTSRLAPVLNRPRSIAGRRHPEALQPQPPTRRPLTCQPPRPRGTRPCAQGPKPGFSASEGVVSGPISPLRGGEGRRDDLGDEGVSGEGPDEEPQATAATSLRSVRNCKSLPSASMTTVSPSRRSPLRTSRASSIEDLALDEPLQRPRPEDRLEASFGKPFSGRGRDLQVHLAIPKPIVDLIDLDLDDLADLVLRERLEDDDLVDPVQELGPEVARSASITRSASPPRRPASVMMSRWSRGSRS